MGFFLLLFPFFNLLVFCAQLITFSFLVVVVTSIIIPILIIASIIIILRAMPMV